GIEPVIGLHRNDRGAKPPRLAHEGAGLDAEGFGGVARGNRTGGVREGLYDDDGLAAQGTPASPHRLPNATEVYWLPWSLWWMTSLGRRWPTATCAAGRWTDNPARDRSGHRQGPVWPMCLRPNFPSPE